MNKKLTLILITNLVMAGPMVPDVNGASVEQPLLEPQTTTSSSSIGFSLTERMEQLKQQVNTFRGHLSSIIRYASDDGEDLGILGGRLREQIEKEAGAEAAPRADLMPYATDASIQADDPDTFVWDGNWSSSSQCYKSENSR